MIVWNVGLRQAEPDLITHGCKRCSLYKTAKHWMAQSDISAAAGIVTLHGSKLTIHSETTASSLYLPYSIFLGKSYSICSTKVLTFVRTWKDK